MRLIDAEEIEELFYKQVEYGATDLVAAFDDALQDARTVYAAEFLRVQWISVEERLPDKEGKYLVTVYDGITPDVLYFYKRYPYCNSGIRTDRPVWCGYDDYGDFEVKSVTHWMPLPEPPEE